MSSISGSERAKIEARGRAMLHVGFEGTGVRIGERFVLTFQRTLRLPDDGREYPLPPGLGEFPIRRVEDFADRVPESWRGQGGVFFPMYQREALWLAFEAASWKPNAVKIGLGGINALTGDPWDETLRDDPQDYIVCPPQPWLDGIKVGDGQVRQFVAMPLGSGTTVESQLTGQELVGGLQIVVFEAKPGRFPDEPPWEEGDFDCSVTAMAPSSPAMGLGAGGVMKQKIYPDPYGLDTWDLENRGVLRVHIVNSEQYRELTGSAPPPTPIDARAYSDRGFPWFDLYDEKAGDLPTRRVLADVKSIREIEGGGEPEPSIELPGSQVRKLGIPEL
jgi:hypothetical protein